MKHIEFTARTELKSLTRSIKCMETECGDLELLSDCLGDSSMRLGVPFIAPRQLGAVGDQQGRQFLPSVGWHTGQSGAPPDSHCSMSGADLLPNLAQPAVATPGWLAHQTLSGAHRIVRCPSRSLARATRRPWIAQPTVALAAIGSPDSPGNYSHTPSLSPESGRSTLDSFGAPDTVWYTTGQFGAPRPSSSWLYTANSFPIYFLLFLVLRHNTLVPKSMY
jgi:hypothetical protein